MGFSRASRLRLLKFIAKVDWKKIPCGIFVTLTYPPSHGKRTLAQRNKDRYLFLRHLEEHLGHRITGIWRVEWKPRLTGNDAGEIVPHYHFVILKEKYVHYKLIRNWWRGILKVKGPLATDVRAIINGELAGFYIAKYVAKVQPLASLDNCAYHNSPGRHYGFIRRNSIPLCPVESIAKLTEPEIDYLLSEGRDRLSWLNFEALHSFSFLGKASDEIFDSLAELVLDRQGDIHSNT